MNSAGMDAGAVRQLACNYKVHQHDETCYQEVPVLDENGLATGKTEKVLVCDQVEYVVHEHNADCYENGVLVCPLPEIKAHVHDQKCYEMQEELVCPQPEHTHTQACYQDVEGSEEPVLICGQTEHVHSKQ